MAKPGKPEKRDSNRQPEAPPIQAPPSAPRASAFALVLQWFLSRTVRHARAMCKHVRKTLNHQRDILKPNAIEQVQAAVGNLELAVATKADRVILTKQMENLDKVAQDWLKPYPNPTIRENVEVLLVALTVAMAVRTFFLQPFKIPTASMQPTLFGVTSKVLGPDTPVPTGLDRVQRWFGGSSFLHIVAEEDGEFLGADEPVRFLIFSLKQNLNFAGKTKTIWFPPDYGSQTLEQRAGIHPHQVFHKGEDIVKVQIDAGDHLFVNRLTYNFRPPERGEIVVFETHGITRLDPSQQDTFYIKRLVGFGGETLTIRPEYEFRSIGVWVGELVVNGKPLSASTPHFEALYSFSGVPRGTKALHYEENHYYGHALISSAGALPIGYEFHVEPGHFFVMGDNTMNSSDSRFWGGVPQEKLIGKSFFVYWPITGRFGWGQR
jgi:signal peptidase I